MSPALALCAVLATPLLAQAQSGVIQDPQVQSATAALIRQGRYTQAEALLAPALARNPDSPQLLTLNGMARALAGDPAGALRNLRRATQVAPTFLPALRSEAQVLAQTHSPELPGVLAAILKIDPTDATAQAMLAAEEKPSDGCDASASPPGELRARQAEARCQFAAGRYDKAVATLSALLAGAPASKDYRYDLGLAQLRAGQPVAALMTLQPLTTGPGADEDTLSLASDAAEAAGNTPQAVAYLRRCIELDPTDSDTYVRFAELCMAHESYQPGIDLMTAGLSRLPHSSALYLARGMLYGGEASYAQAEADFRSAELYDPKHGTGDYGVGIVQLQANDPVAALASTRAALHRHPDDARLNLLLARLLLEQDAGPGPAGLREGTAAAERAVQLNPSLVAARVLLAKADMLNSDPKGAMAQCEAALKIEPDNESALYRMMLAARQSGDLATAHALARRVAGLHDLERTSQTEKLRYRLVEAPPPPAQPLR